MNIKIKAEDIKIRKEIPKPTQKIKSKKEYNRKEKHKGQPEF